MSPTDNIHDLLLRSLDQALEPAEQERLTSALEQSNTLRKELEQLLQMRQILAQQTVSTTPANFSQEVMTQLQRPKVIQLNRWMPQIAAACLLLLFTALLSIYSMEGTLSTEALLGVQDLSPEEAYTLLTY